MSHHPRTCTRSVPSEAVGERIILVVIALLLCMSISGCWLWQQPAESGVAALEKFESAEALKAYLAEQYTRPPRGSTGVWLPFLAMPMAGAPDSALSGGEDSGDYSSTNVQEEGVDEADVVKNDGTYLYLIGGEGLRIAKVVPADAMALAAEVALPGEVQELYLRGDQVIALGLGEEYDTTVVSFVDVTDRSAPVVETTLEFDGALAASRLIDARLHLVLQMWPEWPGDGSEEAIRGADVDELIPDVAVSVAGGEPVRRNVAPWQDFYRPVDPDGYSMTTVVTVSADDPAAEAKSVAVVADAGTVYASREALYVTDYNYNWQGEERPTTDIYKFDLREEGPVLAAGGSVPGRLLNRFSLGEHEGFLRTATTTAQTGGMLFTPTATSNNVYVLVPEEGALKIVGRVEGIAPGESIYSARFIGTRGFLVTYEKVDPLFTLDLSDPAAPRVVGELKVPGYSDYLHPMGENHLLAMGKDALVDGDMTWYQGVQVSLFDVTDFADPQRVDVETVGVRGTESEALQDAHAFNYFEPEGMLAVPMTVAENAGPEPWAYGLPTFRGICVYEVSTETGIAEAGRIATEPVVSEMYYWNYGWARGVFIGDHVYAVTAGAVRAVPLADIGAAPQELTLD
jgi:uncharacterized secreted protein with C-terminal beta-propeller domain